MHARHLDPRIRTVWRITGTITIAVVALVLLAATSALVTTGSIRPAALVIPLVVLAAGTIGAWWWAGVRYDHWTYRLGADALELESGVVLRTRSVIPYFRVQHVETAQGPVERRLDLVNLKVHTASSATDAALPGLSSADAEEVRRVVLERAGAGDAV